MKWRLHSPFHGSVAAVAVVGRLPHACSTASFHCGGLAVPVAEAFDLATVAAVVVDDDDAVDGVAGCAAAAAVEIAVVAAGQGVS